MPKIQITLALELMEFYADQGHPLGKNRRGRKKWLKRMIIEILTNFAEKNDGDSLLKKR